MFQACLVTCWAFPPSCSGTSLQMQPALRPQPSLQSSWLLGTLARISQQIREINERPMLTSQ